MARGRKPDPIVQERIRTIADMMAAGVYVTRDTPRKLAAKWGCSTKTVENYATRAARFVRASLGDDERLKTEILAYLKRVTSICIKRGTEVYPDELPDGSPHPNAGQLRERNAYQWLNTGIQAADRIASLAGLDAEKKPETKSEYTLDEITVLKDAIGRNTCPQRSPMNEPSSSARPSPTSGRSAGSSKSSRSTAGGKSSS